jgi:hypothetical protein
MLGTQTVGLWTQSIRILVAGYKKLASKTGNFRWPMALAREDLSMSVYMGINERPTRYEKNETAAYS